MRTIKFRGKRLDNGEWVYGGFAIRCRGAIPVILEEDEDSITFRVVYRRTVSQFTGLLDKNSKEIYEGDIVKYDYTVKERGGSCKQKAEINYIGFRQSECKFIVVCKNRHHDLHEPYNLQVKVIGNIHDNPELLKHD